MTAKKPADPGQFVYLAGEPDEKRQRRYAAWWEKMDAFRTWSVNSEFHNAKRRARYASRPPTPAQVSAAAAAMGRLGGRARWAGSTPEERRAAATKASHANLAKRSHAALGNRTPNTH